MLDSIDMVDMFLGKKLERYELGYRSTDEDGVLEKCLLYEKYRRDDEMLRELLAPMLAVILRDCVTFNAGSSADGKRLEYEADVGTGGKLAEAFLLQ